MKLFGSMKTDLAAELAGSAPVSNAGADAGRYATGVALIVRPLAIFYQCLSCGSIWPEWRGLHRGSDRCPNGCNRPRGEKRRG